MKSAKQLNVYQNDSIYVENDGTFTWVSNNGDDERFGDVSDLLNFAKEDCPQTYESILTWAEEFDL